MKELNKKRPSSELLLLLQLAHEIVALAILVLLVQGRSLPVMLVVASPLLQSVYASLLFAAPERYLLLQAITVVAYVVVRTFSGSSLILPNVAFCFCMIPVAYSELCGIRLRRRR